MLVCVLALDLGPICSGMLRHCQSNKIPIYHMHAFVSFSLFCTMANDIDYDDGYDVDGSGRQQSTRHVLAYTHPDSILGDNDDCVVSYSLCSSMGITCCSPRASLYH